MYKSLFFRLRMGHDRPIIGPALLDSQNRELSKGVFFSCGRARHEMFIDMDHGLMEPRERMALAGR
jgi:hypothetical protein